MRPALLATIPGRPVLSGLLRLLLAERRREEFIGDLVEEARHHLAGATDEALASWLWAQTLRSVPALVILRVRHALAERPVAGRALALAGPRLAHRGWSLSVAVSVAAHLTALTLLVAWALSRVDELEPVRIPVSFPAFLPTPPSVEPAPPAERPEPRLVRAGHRPPTRPSGPPPIPGPGPTTAVVPPPLNTEGPPDDGGMAVAEVPPHVAEKRCLFCPEPHLPAPYQRLGLEQELLVKTCVNAHGDVSNVETLRGLGAAVDAQVRETVRGWRFAPHTVDGHPVPFCYTTRFVFAMR
jgi:TonB family protein